MSLFKNEKLDQVNVKLQELQEKREKCEAALSEISAALDNTVELFALGQVTEKTLEKLFC